MKRPFRLGILCGGGPAPGMNSVISAAAIEALNRGWEVLGIPDGFEHLIQRDVERVEPLRLHDVSRIHIQGGTILYTSRANPTKRDEEADDPEWRLNNTVSALKQLKLDGLLTIGGDDTAFSASKVAAKMDGALKVVHVPKTIDNDLPLPGGAPTFGFETARHVGTELVNNLMVDAMTTRRWYFLVAMGRSAGHLALGIGKASGSTLTIIAEEFEDDRPIRLKHLVDIIETSMLKRMAMGQPFGVCVLSEGIGLRLPADELQQAMPSIERDAHGHIRLAELHLHRILTTLVRLRFHARGDDPTIVAKNIGYELRCAPPIPFDVEYTRDLGYGAVATMHKMAKDSSGDDGAMVTLLDGSIRPLPFGSFNDPETGRPQIRTVDTDKEKYHVAREYMIRLDADDFDNTEKLARLAEAARLSPEKFRKRYGYLIERGARTNRVG